MLIHDIGGNPDNYVVDMQFKNHYGGRHVQGFGRDTYFVALPNGTSYPEVRGAWWQDLYSNSITIARGTVDQDVDYVRIRIWVYN
jgi:hypothetical protein